MSYDARYIFVYDDLGYLPPTPMEKDIEYLKEKYGGEFIRFEETSTFWDKPKYTLLDEELEKLLADQVLERGDGEIWEIIK